VEQLYVVGTWVPLVLLPQSRSPSHLGSLGPAPVLPDTVLYWPLQTTDNRSRVRDGLCAVVCSLQTGSKRHPDRTTAPNSRIREARPPVARRRGAAACSFPSPRPALSAARSIVGGRSFKQAHVFVIPNTIAHHRGGASNAQSHLRPAMVCR
jgi:hypothetical protein